MTAMSQTLKDLKLPMGEDLDETLRRMAPDYAHYRILKKSVDARTKQKLHWVYTVELYNSESEVVPRFSLPEAIETTVRPLVIGTGPAGLFAALRLVERGVACDLFERGSPCDQRILAINKYWRYGVLNPENNVCFGEGGAGLYSDGKLITRIKSPHIPYVMKRMVDFGAPPEVEYLANPHIGSNKIRRLIPRLREYLLQKGCRIHFNTRVEKILFENQQVTGLVTAQGQTFHSPYVVAATGHSAEDMIHYLHESGVTMEGKSFAVGLRVEHHQDWVNKTQYREFSEHPELGAANYKLAHHNKREEVGVYSFCMCPGGYVLSSGTSPQGVVSNGMSNFNRNSPYANAAIVVSIDHQKMFSDDVLGGLHFRKKLEESAYQMVQNKKQGHALPAQNMIDFLLGRETRSPMKGSSPSGMASVRLDQLFPANITLHMIEAFEKFHKKLEGFISPQAHLYGVESRTSCPVRVIRDQETLESVSHRGLFPSGEGAGYAGGITSAACDGIRVADSIVHQLASQKILNTES